MLPALWQRLELMWVLEEKALWSMNDACHGPGLGLRVWVPLIFHCCLTALVVLGAQQVFHKHLLTLGIHCFLWWVTCRGVWEPDGAIGNVLFSLCHFQESSPVQGHRFCVKTTNLRVDP